MAVAPDVLTWLLDSDPALRWQVQRDLAGDPPEVWQATRARVATEGFGARLLAHQDPDGQWAGGAYFPSTPDGCSAGGTTPRLGSCPTTPTSRRRWPPSCAPAGCG